MSRLTIHNLDGQMGTGAIQPWPTDTVNSNDENVNISYSKDTEGIIAELKKMLISGWRGALPDATIQV